MSTRAERKRAANPDGFQPVEREKVLTPTLSIRVDPEYVPWIYASLIGDEHQAVLYTGKLHQPFDRLHYVVGLNQNALHFAVVLEPSEQFDILTQNHPVGRSDILPMLKRYSSHTTSADGTQLFVNKNDEIQGVISRNQDGQINIQKRVDFQPSEDNAINNLVAEMGEFNLLVQRYVGNIWALDPESRFHAHELRLIIPKKPDDAQKNYFSVFEIVGKGFRVKPRDVELNDIGGYQRAKEIILGLYMDLTDPETSRKLGTQPHSNKFVLISGDTGTGKSLFPKAFDRMLRERYGDAFDHFRIDLGELIMKHGGYAPRIMSTILDHIKEREKQKPPAITLLHLNNLEYLMTPHERNIRFHPESSSPVPQSEYQIYYAGAHQIKTQLADFGAELGSESRHTVVLGESKLTRTIIPEDIAKIFRRFIHLQPDVKDLAEIIRVQVRTTRQFARSSNRNPFSSDTDTQIDKIAARAEGLTGRDIQQAVMSVAEKHKAYYKGGQLPEITPAEITEAVDYIKNQKGLARLNERRRIGLPTSRDII